MIDSNELSWDWMDGTLFFSIRSPPTCPPQKKWCPFGNSHDFSPCQKLHKKVVEALRSCVCNDVSTVAHAVEFAPQGWYCSARETQWLICFGLVTCFTASTWRFTPQEDDGVFLLFSFEKWRFGQPRGFCCWWNQIWIQLFTLFKAFFGLKTCVFAMFPVQIMNDAGFYRMIPHWNLIGLEMGWRLDLLG